MLTSTGTGLKVSDAKNALYIKERYELAAEDFTTDLKLKNLEKWRTHKNLINEESFQLKLRYENYEKSKLDAVLKPYTDATSTAIDTYVKNSKWFQIFNESFDLVNAQLNPNQEINWGLSIRNFLLWIEKELNRIFDSNNQHFTDKDQLIKELLETIGIELIAGVLKSAVLELQIAKLEGKLHGETSEERFQSFLISQFGNKEKAVEFYSEYIVLARLLTLKSIYYVQNIEESFTSFVNDKKILIKEMAIEDLIVAILPGKGDTHQKGKTVIEFKFQNKSIYYKPKNLGVASSYNDLIRWINGKNQLLKMPVYNLIHKGNYSWEDQVAKKNCDTKEQVESYFEKFGQTIAIMHCLKGGDFHLENIIASGEDPIIIDLETVFQQRIPLAFPDSAEVVAKNDYLESVMNTLLLPNRIYQNSNDTIGIDMSALNGREQEMSIPVVAPDKHNTEDMTFTQQENLVINSDHSNLPFFEGEFVDFNHYKDNIYKGFLNTCNFFIQYRDELIHQTSLMKNFKDHPVRVILRPTQKYAQMLYESLHPDYLRDGLQRDQVLENMWGYLFQNKTVASHEISEMIVGDIPIFFNFPGSRDIYDGNNQKIENFFDRSAYDLVLNRINGLNEDEINKQLSWIKVSLKDYETSTAHPVSNLKYTVANNHILVKENLIKEAHEIGQRILKDPYYSADKSSISWLDLVMGKNNEHSIEPMPVDFYDGTSGVALLFYYLYKTTEDEAFNTAYHQILNSLNQDEKIYMVSSPSAGPASILQMISRIPETNKTIEQLLDKSIKYVKENIRSLQELDYLSGLTGLINTFLDLYKSRRDKIHLQTAISIGEQLVLKLEKDGLTGVGGGMAHGASGISYVLFKLSSYSQNQSFYFYAKLFLERDREFFNKECGAWLDEKKRYTHQWCHGSSGIGLSRVLIKEFYQDDFINEEIDIAHKAILDQGYKSSDCLCHGNMGDIEFFLSMNTTHSEKKYLKLLQQILEDKLTNNDYRINSLPGFDKKGLFTGLSGIAYEMLRVADPKNIPSVLY